MNIPQLRFPEFTGEWERKKLGEVVSYTKGYAFKSENYITDGTRIIRVSDLGADNIRYGNDKIFIEKSLTIGLDKYIIKKNDIIITTVGSKPALLESAVGRGIFIDREDEGILNQNLLKLNSSTEINNKFIFGYINSQKYISYIKEIQRGNANQSNITVFDLFEYKFSFPTLPEQTKIANFLTAVDEKIQALKKKKSHLENYKKGVMQRLFANHDGRDARPCVFTNTDGKPFPEWEVKKLGEVLIKNSTKNKNQKHSLVQSVSNKYGFINQDEMFEDRRVASKDTSNYYVIEKGHFAYNPSRIDVGSLAYKFDNEISTISPLYISFRANQIYLTDEFLLNWFSIEEFQMQMNNSFEGSVRNTLSYESLVRMKISIPSLPEQTRIANFLSSIDEKIKNTNNQITQTETWKKGLLQKMFI